jgi:hypothetical protein
VLPTALGARDGEEIGVAGGTESLGASFNPLTEDMLLTGPRRGFINCSASPTEPANLRVRLECRRYELGWILWSFARCADLSPLTHNPIFVEALDHSQNLSV